MSKTRKQYKRSTLSKLSSESFVCSSLFALSSFFVWLFRGGALSFITKSAEKTDKWFRSFIADHVADKLKLHDKVKVPAKKAVSDIFVKSRLFAYSESVRVSALNMSLRSVGIFLLTFSIYSAAIFVLKYYYASFGDAEISDISVAATVFIAGLVLLCFGEKSVLSALGNGRITGSLLAGCLGVNESSFVGNEKERKTHVGIMFLLGSLCGVLTLFQTPARILFYIFILILITAVMNMPEFGLLLSVFCVSFTTVKFLSVLVLASLVSYLLKCLRLKRNMRFGTADVAVLFIAAIMLLCSATAGISSDGNACVVIFVGVYFLSKNLLCSGRLIFQSFNTVCLSVCFGTLLYIVKDFSELITYEPVYNIVSAVTPYTVSADILALLVTSLLPFSLSVTSKCIGKRRALAALLLSAACTVATDSMMFYILDAVAVMLYFAIAFKAPAGTLLASIIVFPPLVTILNGRLCGKLLSPSSNVAKHSVFGGDGVNGASGCSGFWSALASFSGIITVLLFILMLLLMFQRIFSVRGSKMQKHNSCRCGTIIASAVMLTVDLFIFNPFSDIRVFIAVWFVFGLCGSAYYEFRKPQYYHDPEEQQ